MKRLTLLGLALSALAAITITATGCAGGDGLVTATPLSSSGGTGPNDSRNVAGEVFDSLLNGSSVGTRSGNTTFIPGKGLQFNDRNAYLTYETFYPLVNGEFSMEVENLRPNAWPAAGKPKIFQIGDLRDADLTFRTSMINAQYRGGPGGNPDNAIAFKAVLGSSGAVAEPDSATRVQGQRNLDPSRTYYWQGRWTNNSFHLLVKDGGDVIYDLTLPANGGTGFSASQMFAFIGSNDAKYNDDVGTFPGMIVRNVWLSDKPRP